MGRLNEQHAEARQQRQLSSDANPADFSEALARGLAVLAEFGAERKRMTQADLARRLGLSRATVRRAVLTLEHLGYLTADGRTYELAPRILGLAEGYLSSNTVSTIVQPVCERISRDFKALCSAAVLDGADAVMVARSAPQSLLMVHSGVGYRVPAQISALGKVLLAHLPPSGAGTLNEDHENEIFEEIRRVGHCYVANDVESGFHSIAVPIKRWDGRVVAALNVGGTIDQLPAADMFGRVLETIQQSAKELQKQIV